MNVDFILDELLSHINVKYDNDKKNVAITKIATDIIDVLGLCRVNGTVYWYTGTHYQIANENVLMRGIGRLLKDESKVFVAEVLFKVNCFTKEVNLDTERKFLSVKNGLIDLDDVVRYGNVVLREHSKEFFCTYYLDIDYKKKEQLSYAGSIKLADFIASFTYSDNSNIKDEKLRNELKEVLQKAEKGEIQENDISSFDKMLLSTYMGNKNISVEMYNTLFEIVAYFLYPSNFLKKMFFVVGNKHNGKSTFFNFLTGFFGIENCTFLDFAMLSKPFGCSQLENAWINFGDDISNFRMIDTSIFKKLASGDVLNVERKYKENLTITHAIKCLFSANVLPEIKLDSASLDRLFIVPFENTFEVCKNRKIHILNEVKTTEVYEVLLNWALEKLPGIVKNGKMTYQDYYRFENKIEEYQSSNSILVNWIQQKAKSDDEKFEITMANFLHQLPIPQAFDDFKEYCFMAGEKDIPIPLRNFVKELQALNVPCKKVRKMFNGERNVMLEFPNQEDKTSDEKIIYINQEKSKEDEPFLDYVDEIFK